MGGGCCNHRGVALVSSLFRWQISGRGWSINGKQKFVIWAATFLVVAMGLYPPWVHVHRWSQERRYAYGWIFLPPPSPTHKAPSDDPFRFSESGSGPLMEPEPGWQTELDVSRLLIEWVTVCLATGGLI